MNEEIENLKERIAELETRPEVYLCHLLGALITARDNLAKLGERVENGSQELTDKETQSGFDCHERDLLARGISAGVVAMNWTQKELTGRFAPRMEFTEVYAEYVECRNRLDELTRPNIHPTIGDVINSILPPDTLGDYSPN